MEAVVHAWQSHTFVLGYAHTRSNICISLRDKAISAPSRQRHLLDPRRWGDAQQGTTERGWSLVAVAVAIETEALSSKREITLHTYSPILCKSIDCIRFVQVIPTNWRYPLEPLGTTSSGFCIVFGTECLLAFLYLIKLGQHTFCYVPTVSLKYVAP